MHPELKHALDANLSALEVIRLFTKHHSGISEERVELVVQGELEPSDCSFWDTWQPLGRFTSHPGSRSSVSRACLSIHSDLTREIISWLSDSGRRSNVYLIQEAQMQTDFAHEILRANAFASICYDAHRFGLPLRGTLDFPPDMFRICAALATHYPPFRRILTKILFDNTEIRNMPKRTQFKKLIYEPWKSLQISHPQYVAEPPVIVLRWYDRTSWPLYEEDKELLHSIYEFASPRQALPLLWIISLSPEFELPIQDLFDSFECPRLTRLPVCYNDASADTELCLNHRFSILRQKHMEIFTEHEPWPSEEQISQLITIFSGSFDSIEVVIEFIDWEGDGGPKAHLETFLAYMVDSPSPSGEQPYCALDHFYTQALYAIPPDLLSVVKRVLSICYCKGRLHNMTSFLLACLLSVGQDTVLGVLRRLCRWAVILHREDGVDWYDPCPFFRGFLEDAKRSTCFNISKFEIGFLTYEVSLRILCHYPNPSESLKPVGRFAPKAQGSDIKKYMDIALWTFYYVSATGSHPEWTLLRRFDFRFLAHSQGNLNWNILIVFAKELYAWDKKYSNHSPNIVRAKPAGRLDRQLIEKCEGLAEPLDLEEKGGWWQLRPTGPNSNPALAATRCINSKKLGQPEHEREIRRTMTTSQSPKMLAEHESVSLSSLSSTASTFSSSSSPPPPPSSPSSSNPGSG
ncbi:hypothetical protein AGABI2DRAFT_116618 [Agaricus bisporus var. bisporus H97]|uniref:hypothetical protein n=1 Tax=Agaricus bisporus var. bisporus (strain H97 / ATCC MYA-4626 / FGSC 10389) TaxID=936046 RepID=UPI00029F6F72|nr:hypothetical protein AGABI2DRAFT_116618 [Agaricus bisporus var. bisporus H97]EKV49584.1 hypothetical protein AGABI2DRAFT_116618 [Agaricus bisporus var. bisporus H97]